MGRKESDGVAMDNNVFLLVKVRIAPSKHMSHHSKGKKAGKHLDFSDFARTVMPRYFRRFLGTSPNMSNFHNNYIGDFTWFYRFTDITPALMDFIDTKNSPSGKKAILDPPYAYSISYDDAVVASGSR